jgi:glycosyltransferase involved in cell wall biosynthesis
MHLFINGLAASSSSGLTYLRNVIPHLSARSGLRVTLALNQQVRGELEGFPNVSFARIVPSSSALRRFWSEQSLLPNLIRESGADVLISAGNFALRQSPVPQILLSGNSLYTSKNFYRDLRARSAYGLWLDTRFKAVLARRSVNWADCTVAPSEAFARELRKWTGKNAISVHHGFDADLFRRDQTPLPLEIQNKLDSGRGSLRLLFVSYYNYYRNFETLIRAVPLVREHLARAGSRSVKLFLTCKLDSRKNPGHYRAEAASALVQKLGIVDEIVELGPVPYRQLHHVYAACDMYVTPAYTETFAHPLVEAMSCGLPVVASDIEVHREVCDDAALYFPRFSPEDLASRVIQIASDVQLKRSLAHAAQTRAGHFSWKKHVDQLLWAASSLVQTVPAVH